MSYKDRLNKLQGAWEKEKPATGSSLPPGKYQFEIKRATLGESTASFNKGNLQVAYECIVATGNLKGRKHTIRVDLESKPDPKNPNRPSGMAIFKGHLKNLEIDEPKQLTDGAIKKVLEGMVGIVFNGAAVEGKTGYVNVYINDLVHAASSEDDEDEDEDDEDESEDDEDSDEDEDESEDEDEDDESEDDSDDEDDEDDEDDDEEEEKKPAPKKGDKLAAKLSGAKTANLKKEDKKPAKKSEDDDEWDEEFDKA